MKTTSFITLLLAFFVFAGLQAQQDEEMKMLFNKKDKPDSEKQKMANGGYGSFSIGWTLIDGKDAMLFGGRAAWIANHHFGLGMAGRGFFNNLNSNEYYDPNNPYDPNKDPEYALAGGYGGIFFEPIVAPMSPVHVSFPILIGAGGVTATPANWNNWGNSNYDPNNYYYNVTGYFVFEPGVDVEFNITKFFRIALGGSYRYTSDINLYYQYYDALNVLQYDLIPKNALRGFNVDISFKFGWF